jgi:hypothetical protein
MNEEDHAEEDEPLLDHLLRGEGDRSDEAIEDDQAGHEEDVEQHVAEPQDTTGGGPLLLEGTGLRLLSTEGELLPALSLLAVADEAHRTLPLRDRGGGPPAPRAGDRRPG